MGLRASQLALLLHDPDCSVWRWGPDGESNGWKSCFRRIVLCNMQACIFVCMDGLVDGVASFPFGPYGSYAPCLCGTLACAEWRMSRGAKVLSLLWLSGAVDRMLSAL